MHTSEITSNPVARRPTLTLVAAVIVSAAPLLILAVPAALQLPAVQPLLHESEIFPGFSRAFLVAPPLTGLVVVNAVIFAATRSLRSVVAAALITSAVAVLVVLRAVGLVNNLNEFFGGVD
jgi:hypothetical protein